MVPGTKESLVSLVHYLIGGQIYCQIITGETLGSIVIGQFSVCVLKFRDTVSEIPGTTPHRPFV